LVPGSAPPSVISKKKLKFTAELAESAEKKIKNLCVFSVLVEILFGIASYSHAFSLPP